MPELLIASPAPSPGLRRQIARVFKRVADRDEWPRQWHQAPSRARRELSAEEFKRQHDETSKAINRLVVTLVSFSLFCLLTLFSQHDRSLLAADAMVTLPFANSSISFLAFLVIGPIVLIGITAYLQVFIGYWLGLSCQRRGDATGAENFIGLPYIFNLDHPFARSMSAFIFYWLLPFVLMVFAWKALPRPESPILVMLASVVTAGLVILQLRRRSQAASREYIYLMWFLLAVAVASLVLGSCDFLGFRASPGGRRFFSRTLRLRKADLRGQDLRGVDLSGADLRDANLANANLSGMDLVGASMNGADLESADLDSADVSGTDLTETHYLTQDQFEMVCYDAETQVPPGVKKPSGVTRCVRSGFSFINKPGIRIPTPNGTVESY